MKGSGMRAGVVGFAGGVALVVVTLVLEVLGRGLPLRGGLLALQLDSVTVWVLESLPILIGGAAFVIAGRPIAPAPSPAPVPLGTPPPAPFAATPAPPPGAPLLPPPVPEALQGANLLGSAGSDHRVRALEELVKVLREQASEAASESRAKSSYLANMSHELRTPLNAIIGYAELLAEEALEDGPALVDDLNKVAQAGHQLVGLINNILDLSKIEVGQLAIVLEDVDLAQVVDEIRVAVNPLVSVHGNTFSVRLVPGARLVRGDHMRIRQVLMNLLGNAFKFTQNGNVTLTIERSEHRRAGWVAIRVKDTGIGLDPDEIDRVFDEYRQAAARVSDDPGTGLGLAISRKLAELMGGRLDATSEKGMGSTFSLLLPPTGKEDSAVPARSTVALNERLNGLRLLLVDADPSGVTLARYFERAGLHVELIKDPMSARIAARSEAPDMVIVDAGMVGAWGLTDELVTSGVQVVVTSLRDEDVEPALQRGVTAFLVRPVPRKLALATLERCLDR